MDNLVIDAKDVRKGDIFLDGVMAGFVATRSARSTPATQRQIIPLKRSGEEIFAVLNSNTQCHILREEPRPGSSTKDLDELIEKVTFWRYNPSSPPADPGLLALLSLVLTLAEDVKYLAKKEAERRG